jgi:CO dehydrogenase maturation factor
MIIAMTGKGGVGKTSLSAMIINWLVQRGETPILAVDADSNANLNEALGVSMNATVGGIREDARAKAQETMKGISKQEFLELRVQEALIERPGYDLIVMGRPEGRGCYCFANNVLREVLDRLAHNYRHVVIDSEAGLEHISRRTLLSVDQLILVSDCSIRGVRTTSRISALADEVQLDVKKRGLIINRAPHGILLPNVQREAESTGLPLLAVIPLDDNITALDAAGVPFATIPQDAPARMAVDAMLEQMFAAQLEGVHVN